MDLSLCLFQGDGKSFPLLKSPGIKWPRVFSSAPGMRTAEMAASPYIFPMYYLFIERFIQAHVKC